MSSSSCRCSLCVHLNWNYLYLYYEILSPSIYVHICQVVHILTSHFSIRKGFKTKTHRTSPNVKLFQIFNIMSYFWEESSYQNFSKTISTQINAITLKAYISWKFFPNVPVRNKRFFFPEKLCLFLAGK